MRHPGGQIVLVVTKVSIHASVKDATNWDYPRNIRILVSIHASVKDATVSTLIMSDISCFNPRICKRCDITAGRTLPSQRVSIHASVKDATKVVQVTSYRGLVSIHASVKDATLRIAVYMSVIQVSIHASVKDATPCL